VGRGIDSETWFQGCQDSVGSCCDRSVVARISNDLNQGCKCEICAVNILDGGEFG